MTDNTEELNAAQEAAQAVVDSASSWEYSGDSSKIDQKLREGFAEAGVTVDDAEISRLVSEIDALKDDEDAGTPQVSGARPANG